MNMTERAVTRETAKLMEDASIFIQTVASLIVEDLIEREDDEGKRFLDGFRTDGLMRGLSLIGECLSDRSEFVKKAVQQSHEEEQAEAALARRPGQTSLDSTNVRVQS